jgi:NADH:ubiquinone oxidoreductase subunit 5 (subunit L)/multisubunit Na+/H+ antiporter MnhA subunit
LRVLCWVIALPLGLAIVGLPARKAGYLSSQKLLDVIVKSDLSRFVPIVVIILLWALVSALLVTLFVEGGRRFLARRHRKSAASASAPVPARAGRR